MKLLLEQINRLATLTTDQLKERWREFYGQEAPIDNQHYLVKRLTYRLQELDQGVNQELASRLKKLSRNEVTKNGKASYVQPNPGSRLIRSYRGEEHEVLVLDKGYQYRDKTCRSLSKIANLITGSAWSGPVFFGLQRKDDHE